MNTMPFDPMMMGGPGPSMMGGPMMPPPPGGIPGPSISSTDSTIASMRWENDELRNELIILLGNYQKKLMPDGTVQFYRNPQGPKPLMNDDGIMTVIATIRGTVNGVTSLSNIDEQDSNELAFQVITASCMNMALGQQRFGMRVEDLYVAANIVKTIVFTQLKRAVGGHESKSFTTQHVEQHVQQQASYRDGSGWNFWPRGGKNQ